MCFLNIIFSKVKPFFSNINVQKPLFMDLYLLSIVIGGKPYITNCKHIPISLKIASLTKGFTMMFLIMKASSIIIAIQ